MSTARRETDGLGDEHFFATSPLMLFPETSGKFEIYLRVKGKYLLYAKAQEQFSEAHRRKLHEFGIKEIHVLTDQRKAFDEYLEKNLGAILQNDEVPVRQRSRVFYDVSTRIIRETLESRLPPRRVNRLYHRIWELVKQSTRFLTLQEALTNLGSLISHDYYTYTHSVNVMVYTVGILQSAGFPEDDLLSAGMGGILHDMGKAQIPASILNKRDRLSPDERKVIEQHPIWGVAMCAAMPLSGISFNCILFHHEKYLGGGYPSGSPSVDMPLYVKAVSAADVYDALTTDRPYKKAVNPYRALTIMKDEMSGHFDEEILKHLIKILSGAKIIDRAPSFS